ncbi:MAG: cysteine desulfurase [Bdellovibrionales bacterium]|nr:cysteine desulfurase [Bdellovibrionales bacterium]
MTQQPLTVCGSKNIYLDHNATTPIATSLLAMIPRWLEKWGNPSSIHWNGREPKTLLRESRKQLSEFINATSPLEVIFTSGGSEANNLALFGSYSRIKELHPQRTEIVTSGIEHPSVLKTLEHLCYQFQLKLIKIPVNRYGIIDLDDYLSHLSEKTALVSVMFANNETGTILPIKEMVNAAHEVGALFHTDAVQSLGKTKVDVKDWGVDLASFSAHKFYSLKGCGFLYIKQGTPLNALIHGGGQERGRRAGTENILAIAAMAHTSQWGALVQEKNQEIEKLRDKMEAEILKNISNVEINGLKSPRLANTSSLIIEGVSGESLLINLDIAGFSVSTGAACSAGNPEPSPVLLAMGLSRQQAQSSLRVSLGWTTTADDIDQFVKALKDIVNHLRSIEEENKYE